MENESVTVRTEEPSPVATTEEETGSDVQETPAAPAESPRIGGVVIGRLVRSGASAEVLVDYPDNPSGGPLSALATAETSPDDVGRDVALAFQGGDPGKPVMLGFLEHPRPLEVAVDAGEPEADGSAGGELEARVDDERLVLSAEKEIVLRCGRSSITLTRAGKVLIRGRYLLSRSAGVNRIKGGSVQIN